MRTVLGMASLAPTQWELQWNHKFQASSTQHRELVTPASTSGQPVASSVAPGGVLGYKPRCARESSPCGVYVDQREAGGEKKPDLELLSLPPWWATAHMIPYGPTQPFTVFSRNPSQFPCAPLCRWYFSILTGSFLLSLAALELYPLLSSNVSIYPCLNLCVLGEHKELQLLFKICFLTVYLWMPLQFKFSFKCRQPGVPKQHKISKNSFCLSKPLFMNGIS